jgi:hypothetical protein
MAQPKINAEEEKEEEGSTSIQNQLRKPDNQVSQRT